MPTADQKLSTKKRPSFVCPWHAQHQNEIGQAQGRRYDVPMLPHTCRCNHCRAYDQVNRTCDPNSRDRCDRCIQLEPEGE